jgi:hypothetical protein
MEFQLLGCFGRFMTEAFGPSYFEAKDLSPCAYVLPAALLSFGFS